METAGEIIFFWVARMIMLGLYRTKKVPFNIVYLHGIVTAKDGQKMSKSKGNVIDPILLAKKYGTDALRMGLIIGNTPGTTTALYEEKIRGYKLFANKLWNVARFVLENTSSAEGITSEYTKNDTQRIEEFRGVVQDITKDIDEYRFYLAGEKLYHYVWHTFADTILEESKLILKDGSKEEKRSRQALLLQILTDILKLLHPFMPFITEEIWSMLPGVSGLLMIESWPKT